MEYCDLSGTWTLLNCTSKVSIQGKLPGCNYLDLLAAGSIQDPFWGQNEAEATWIARDDYSYSRKFDLERTFLAQEHIDLVLTGVDTLAIITLNGQEIAKTENCHRTYRFDVKNLLQEKDNSLEIRFASPYAYIDAHEARNPLGGMGFAKGIGHIRKVQCHFGWDWGPNLPPVGVTGKIGIEAYQNRIDDVEIRQKHLDGKVTLTIKAMTALPGDGQTISCILTDPDGNKSEVRQLLNGNEASLGIEVASPKLWWCNGLGGQPLYDLTVQLLDGRQKIETEVKKQIGLRTIGLDTAKDAIGGQFRFVINGVPIFAKGADWIPTDSFINRTTRTDLEFYIDQAKWANMNMLRVWGGGYYESDDFYELCDRAGILVWQDFAFACSAYPFDEPEFVANVQQEVIDNVKRLRHHASLALWSGNNENELMAGLWKNKKSLYESNYDFYYNVLKNWVTELDETTAYWPGSPSSGVREISADDLDYGDNHLWGIWHGLLPVKTFKRMPARFTSEYGVESFPSMKAIRSFTDKSDINYLDPVMLTHQKSAGGNQKILFYLIDQFRNPQRFEDFVYLSQLTQAGAMRFATDEWRRHMGQCNGSLYWQYNDCWPVASWAGIDYLQQPKAVHYFSREFNKPVCLSNDCLDDRAEIYLENDLPRELIGKLVWKVKDFSGKPLSGGEQEVHIGAVEAKKCLTLEFDHILAGKSKSEVVLSVDFIHEDEVTDAKSWLLVADKFASLPETTIKTGCSIKNGIATITLRADTFARYVYVELEDSTGPFSDNFFDLMPAEEKSITVSVPAGMEESELLKQIHIKSLVDVEPKGSLFGDQLKQFSLRFNRVNFITWILFKFMTKLK